MVGPGGLLLVEESNKYDLTTIPYFFDWTIIMVGPGGLLLVEESNKYDLTTVPYF